MSKLFLISITLSMCACAFVNSYSDIHENDIIQLNKNLLIPADDARVCIQYGQVVNYFKLDNYYAHCCFISLQRKQMAQLIKKDSFKVINVTQTTEPVQLKSTGYRFSLLSNITKPTAVEYFTEIAIYSTKQPDITKLICRHWEDPSDANHLDLKNIQSTLGGIATIISH